MNKVIKVLIILAAVIVAGTGLVLLASSLGRIKKNDPTVLGNTAGNLMNGGLFCEYDGDVYFSNSYDNGALYVISGRDGSFKRLNTSNCFSINIAGNYIYYCTNGTGFSGKGLGSVVRNVGIYRSKLNGTSPTCLTTGAAIAMQLYGNDLYYQEAVNTGTILVKQSTDKKTKSVLSEELINPVSIDNGTIYFNGNTEDHHLYAMDTVTGRTSKLWADEVWSPIYQNGYIYYISLDGKYNLCRRLLSGGEAEVLCQDRVDCFNIYNNVIYYAVSAGENPALYRMSSDGFENEVVSLGIYHNINITSSYTYFTPYDSRIPIYMQSTYGPIAVSVFSQAASAALENTPKK